MPAPFQQVRFVWSTPMESRLFLVAAAGQFSSRHVWGLEQVWNLAGQSWRLIVEEDSRARDIPVQMEERVGSHGPAAVTGLGARYAVS